MDAPSSLGDASHPGGGLFYGPVATLSTACSRALSDRSYDKRKSGALEVEGVIKALMAEQRRTGVAADEGVAKVVRRLANDFIVSSNSNQRKGGLIGLAAVAIGLGPDVGKHLDLLLPPVLKCFDDPEARVRYYATEALYNIIEVSRGAVLAHPEGTHFNAAFHGLCKVFADVDPDVKNGAVLLDRLLKDVVAESERFATDGVIPLFQSYLKVKNPFIRQLLLSWIQALDAVPDLDLVVKLPFVLDGLLDMLADANKSIREGAEKTLAALQSQLVARPPQYAKVISSTVDILVARHTDSTREIRRTATAWIAQFLQLEATGELLVDRFPDLLRVVVRATSEEHDDEQMSIHLAAERADRELRRIARESAAGRGVDEAALCQVALENLASPHRAVRELVLGWAALLLDTVPERMAANAQPGRASAEIVPALLQVVAADPLDEVALQALAALARVARNGNQCDRILGECCALFRRDRALLERRGSLVVRQLCVLLSPATVFLALARIIDAQAIADASFCALFVQTLNVILVTANELVDVRNALRRAWVKALAEAHGRQSVSARTKPAPSSDSAISTNNNHNTLFTDRAPLDDEIFAALFRAWCHNPVSALCLCLLGGAYGLAGRLVDILAEGVEMTVGLLVDADRLVRLLESPALLHVRMQLLRSGPEFEPDLYKALYGVLMLLPQKSEAFQLLQARLSAVTAMQMALAGGGASRGSAWAINNNNNNTSPSVSEGRGALEAQEILDKQYQALLDDFSRVQALQTRARGDKVREKSLLAPVN